MPALKKGGNKKKAALRFKIDLTKPVEGELLDAQAFENYLLAHIKVDGKTNNLGERVNVSLDGKIVTVTAEEPFSKRYLKYLTKRFLKKNQLRDFLRVVATDKNTYDVRFFRIDMDADEE